MLLEKIAAEKKLRLQKNQVKYKGSEKYRGKMSSYRDDLHKILKECLNNELNVVEVMEKCRNKGLYSIHKREVTGTHRDENNKLRRNIRLKDIVLDNKYLSGRIYTEKKIRMEIMKKAKLVPSS